MNNETTKIIIVYNTRKYATDHEEATKINRAPQNCKRLRDGADEAAFDRLRKYATKIGDWQAGDQAFLDKLLQVNRHHFKKRGDSP
jgi:hypothetical protein